MNASVSAVVADALHLLVTLNETASRPAEARQRLQPLQARHPGAKLDLVWEEEAYDGSIHYDVLVHVEGTGTVSLSVCPDGGLPWPLRGIQRWKEHDLARVNHRVVKVSDAIELLDFVGDEVRLTDRLLNACVIREELERDPITIADESLQLGMDAFRRSRGLATAEQTLRWMEERGLSHGALEELVAERLMIAALRDRITADRTDAYFGAHRTEFDVARVAQIEMVDEPSARDAIAQVSRNEIGFFELAERSFRDASPRRLARPLFSSICRGTAADPHHRAVFAARPGEVLGPVPSETGFAVVKVLALEPARLDEETRSAIQSRLFEDWLAARRRAARVEWYWGTTPSAPGDRDVRAASAA